MRDPCPLCGTPIKGMAEMEDDGEGTAVALVIHCPSCGRYLLDSAAKAVMEMADAGQRQKVADHLAARRARGETQAFRLKPQLFV